MSKLAYDKYMEMSARQISEAEFEDLVSSAEHIISVVTDRYYEWNPFDEEVEWKREAYLRAIVEQVDYFSEAGATSYEAINSQPQSISIGRTSISKGSRTSSTGKEEKKSLLSYGSQLALYGTGLMYRGV